MLLLLSMHPRLLQPLALLLLLRLIYAACHFDLRNFSADMLSHFYRLLFNFMLVIVAYSYFYTFCSFALRIQLSFARLYVGKHQFIFQAVLSCCAACLFVVAFEKFGAQFAILMLSVALPYDLPPQLEAPSTPQHPFRPFVWLHLFMPLPRLPFATLGKRLRQPLRLPLPLPAAGC